jgi:hypothetical protein
MSEKNQTLTSVKIDKDDKEVRRSKYYNQRPTQTRPLAVLCTILSKATR